MGLPSGCRNAWSGPRTPGFVPTEVGPEADNAYAEVERLRSDLDGIRKRIRRLVTNLEAQEPNSEIAEDIRSRLEELGTLSAKKQRALEAAEKEMAQVPDPESAESLVGALPLLDVDWELVSDQDFRDLLVALNFEARYEPTKRELTIRVTLVPELTHPDGGRAPLLFVPPAGFEPAHLAPEASALSPELRGPRRLTLRHTQSRPRPALEWKKTPRVSVKG
jgi:hypothetical protein